MKFMTDPESNAMDDRRHAPRHRTFLQGRVFYNNRRSTADCIIRELTDDGARLSFTDPVTLPHSFELHIPNRDQTYRVETIWNHGEEVGVTFGRHAEAPLSPAMGQDSSLAERIEKLEKEFAALKRRISEVELKNS
jgi:hypothetical protein